MTRHSDPRGPASSGSASPTYASASATARSGSRCSTASTSACGRASSSACSGPAAAGSRPCSTSPPASCKPDSGLVEVDGEKVTGPDARRGVVFQQYAIFPWLTVEKNIAFGLTLKGNRRPRAEIREVVARYVDLMGLSGFEKALPKTLSGGMRQRVALARAYATDPDVMLLDEPFAALDAQTREFMQELLHEASQRDRRAAMLITHSVEEAIFLSHRIVVLTNRPTHVHEVVDVDVDVAAYAGVPHRPGVHRAAQAPRRGHALHVPLTRPTTEPPTREGTTMTTLRRLLGTVLVAVLALALAACGALDEGGGDKEGVAKAKERRDRGQGRLPAHHRRRRQALARPGRGPVGRRRAGHQDHRSSTPASSSARPSPAATSTSRSWAASPRTSPRRARARSSC